MKLSEGRRRATLACAAVCLALAAALSCARDSQTRQGGGASSPAPAQTPQQQGGAWRPARYQIKPEELPPPRESESATNPPRVVARPEGAPFGVPPGFRVEPYAAEGFENPRWMVESPNGDVFVADSRANRIQVLRDTNGDGRPDSRLVFAENLNQHFGMAFRENHFYVADTDSVVRFAYRAGQTRAEGPPEKIADLPGRGYNQHWTRNVVFSPDGRKMYVTVGSETNVSVEAEPMRAAVTEFNPDGTGKRIFASGLRNPVGLAFHPTTGAMWATVNERDQLGDDLVPDYLTSVRDGGFYGWPYSYVGRNVDPRRLEPHAADGLQNHPRAFSRRPTRRALRRLPDGLSARRREPHGLGPPRRTPRAARRLAPRQRGRQQHHLARHLPEVTASAELSSSAQSSSIERRVSPRARVASHIDRARPSDGG